MVQIRDVGGNVDIRLSSRPYRIRPVKPREATQSTPPRSKRAPSYLLDPNRAIVPYVDRTEQTTLLDWCSDGEATYSAMLLSGMGGKGKTRLAMQVAAALMERQWDIVEISRAPQVSDPTALRQAPVRTGSLLAIVDYADRWPLAELVEAVAEIVNVYAQRPRVRVLFIARSASLWRDLAAALDPLPLDIAAKPLELGAFASQADEIEWLFDLAVSAFAEALGVTPPLPASSVLQGALGDSPLTMHMTALAAVLGFQPVGGDTPWDVSTFLLRHERRYWQSRTDIGTTTFGRLTFVATLLGPAEFQEAMDALRTLGIGDEELRRRLLQEHRSLYPSPGSSGTDDIYLIPLQPDRFGEDFVAECLLGDDQSRRDLDGLLGFSDAIVTRYTLRTMLDILAACAERHDPIRGIVLNAIRRRPSATRQAGPQLIDVITDHADTSIARAVFTGETGWDDAIPAAIRLGSRLVADQAFLTQAERLRETLDLAQLLVMHGEWKAAQPLVFRAADLLDEVPQDDFATEELRAQLSSLLGLPEIGSADTMEHAQQTIAFLRHAAKNSPDRYNMQLAGVLANHSMLVCQVQGVEAALAVSGEALQIADDHLSRTSNPAVSDMIVRAVAAQNHGVNLTNAGQAREALKLLSDAVSVRSKLYEIGWPNCTRALCSVLHSIMSAFEGLGALDRAIEYAEWNVDIWRRAPQSDPRVVAELASSLSALGVRYLIGQRPEEALRAIEEALSLTAKDQSPVDNVIAITLRSNRSIAYLMSSRIEAAVEAGYDAVEFADRAIRVDSDAPPTMMPLCLFTLGNALRAAERLAEAIAAYAACVSIAESIGEAPTRDGMGIGIQERAQRALTELQQRDRD
ncbi:hypothetical protein ACWDA3_60540 [Nonomuraea rubra]